MKILKIVICAALLVAGLCGCEKIDVNKLEGTWTEQYDPTVFAMDGSVTFTFDGNNGYQLHVYDALSGESHDYSGHYAIDLIDKGTITINPAMSDDSNQRRWNGRKRVRPILSGPGALITGIL